MRSIVNEHISSLLFAHNAVSIIKRTPIKLTIVKIKRLYYLRRIYYFTLQIYYFMYMN